jgi:hypothetical protein
MIEAVLGEVQQLTAFFANMNMPRMIFPTLKNHDRKDRMVIEALAQRSMVRVVNLRNS